MVEVEVVRTNFAPIFFQIRTNCSAICSDNFQICSIRQEGLFFPEKCANSI